MPPAEAEPSRRSQSGLTLLTHDYQISEDAERGAEVHIRPSHKCQGMIVAASVLYSRRAADPTADQETRCCTHLIVLGAGLGKVRCKSLEHGWLKSTRKDCSVSRTTHILTLYEISMTVAANRICCQRQLTPFLFQSGIQRCFALLN